VLAEHDVGLAKPLEKTVVDHCLGTFSRFFAGLEHCHHRAAPTRPGLGQQRTRAHEPRHVHVVAAHVADGGRDTVCRFSGRAARVRQTRSLLDRQRVHVGAQHHRRPIAVPQQAHDPCLSDAGRHLVARGAKSIRRQSRGAGFTHRQLRMRVNILVQTFQARQKTLQV